MTNLPISIPPKCWIDQATGRVATPHNTNPNFLTLRQLVRGLYDLQKIRIAAGNRLCAQVRVRLGQSPGLPAGTTLTPEVQKLLELIKEHHKLLGTGVATAGSKKIADTAKDDEDESESDDPKADKDEAKIQDLLLAELNKEYQAITEKRKNFPTKKSFKPGILISDYSELAIASMYLDLAKQETQHSNRLENILTDFPIYVQFLEGVKGCGSMMSAVILSNLDPYIARYPSSFWKYVGLDVVSGEADGTRWSEGRNRTKGHLVDRTYTDATGKEQVRRSVTYNPDVKTKLVGVLSTCLMKAGIRKDKETGVRTYSTKYAQIYADYKHRLVNHAVYGEHNDGKPDDARNARTPIGEDGKKTKYTITSPGRRNRMALRYMVKMFLLDLHLKWRELEGLEVTKPYHEAKLGIIHRGGA